MLSDAVFGRSGVSEITREAFIRMTCGMTLLMCGIVGIGSWITYDFTLTSPVALTIMLIGCFAIALGAIFWWTGNDDPAKSSLGVAVMSAALGAMIGPSIHMYVLKYGSVIIVQALVITGMITSLMSVVGIIFPQTMRGIGPYLMAALTVLIVAQFAQIIFVMMGYSQATQMPALVWIGILIFALFVAYDWGRALSLPYTWDNAVDASGGLVLDIVNIFLRVLELLSKSQGSSSRSRS